MSQAGQNQQAQINVFTEERFFPIDLERNYEMLENALKAVLGVELEPAAYGMWFAKIDATRFGETEVTIQATPTEGGTMVRITMQRHATTLGIVAGVVFGIPAVIFVVPFLLWLAQIQRRSRHTTRARMITMHRLWTELARAVGAPKRSGYRDRPKRARIHAEEEPEVHEVEAAARPADAEATAEG